MTWLGNDMVLTDMNMVWCTFQLPRAWPRQEPATATSGTMMEGGMQLLNRDGHSISHNSKRHYHDSFVSMNRMRQRGLLCDIVLHVSNKEIKAHKVVLASCSPYFHAMFTSKSKPLCMPPVVMLLWVWWHKQLVCVVRLTSSLQLHRFLPPLPVWGTGGQLCSISLRFPHDTRPLLDHNVSADSQLSGFQILLQGFLSSDPVSH